MKNCELYFFWWFETHLKQRQTKNVAYFDEGTEEYFSLGIEAVAQWFNGRPGFDLNLTSLGSLSQFKENNR